MPLTILIVGAGIAGLSCAIPLGQQGHTVHLFEKSKFSNEVGAALHFAPHAHRILRRWGIDTNDMNPSICLKWRSVDLDGKELGTKFKSLGVEEDEIMIHRQDAHSVLRQHALKSPNVKLHLSSAVKAVDTDMASITLEDGSVYRGDLVVGADGIHSKTVNHLPGGEDCGAYKVGINMYRFMVPTSKAYSMPSVSRLLDLLEYQTTHNGLYAGASRNANMLVLYPCRGGSLLNMATFQPASSEKIQLGTAYTSPGTVEELLDLFHDWPPHMLDLFSLAEDVKHWACCSAKPRRTFVKGKMVCIGDAAHPTLPTHGAGAGMAIEDSAVLGALLDCTATPENVQERLALFNDLRYERATTVKCASEMDGPMGPERQARCEALLKQYVSGDGTLPPDMEAYMWPIDVYKDAKSALQSLRDHSMNGKA